MAVALTNARLASLLPAVLTATTIVVDEGLIVQIGGSVPNDADIVDCDGKLVMPGNVCAHTHVYSALARGMPAPPRVPRDFREILDLVWWRLDRALDATAIHFSGLIGAIDAIRSGTTTLVDHHSSPNYIDGSLDILADAFEAVGARAVLCYEVTDRGGRERRDQGLRENERFLAASRHEIRGMVGAHAGFTLDDDSLERIADLASNMETGVHIHVAEGMCDEEDSLRRSGKRVGQRLVDAGVIDDRSIAAHGVHLSAAEIALLRRKGTWFAHNCRSNMNNAVGRAPVANFGERTALGTDGIDGDMFTEARTAYFRAKEDDHDMGAERIAAMLAAGGDLVSGIFEKPVGRLAPGAAADLVVLDYNPPTPFHPDNLVWHWMFSFTPALVNSVMVAGRWVMREREILGVDEEKVRSEAAAVARSVWGKMEEIE